MGFNSFGADLLAQESVGMGISSVSKVNSSESDADNRTQRRFALSSILPSSSTHIWRSRISWRIACAVFLTIMLVQALVLNLGGVEQFREQQFLSLREQAQSSISSIIDASKKDMKVAPFLDKHVNRLLHTTKVTGLTVYSYKYDFVKGYGNYTHIVPAINSLDETYRSNDGSFYEAIFRGSDLQSIFVVVVQMDSSAVNDSVMKYVLNSIVVMFILSLLVTTVLMIALGRWLLEPMLFMHENLIAAFRNPENPDIGKSPYGNSDEIGVVINLSQKLITQNADNINHLKSTAEDKIHKLAYYDGLTGLPNRALFIKRLGDWARVNNDESVKRFAIVTMDLDHFKDINDSMGYNVGDAILRAVGKRLRSSLPEAATVSRTGEDEYAIMMPLSGDNLKARDVAERALGVLRSEPFKVFNEEFQVRASVGVSTFPDDGSDPDIVLKNADIALNRAKEEGRDIIKEYSEDFDKAVKERFQMLRDLRVALEQDQLQLYYQPQLSLKTGEIIGAEALLRWWKADNSKHGGSFISPADFIPIAEQSGLILPIGKWVLDSACRTAKACKDEHGINIRFAINVSGNQFMQGDICKDVFDILEETGIDPKMIELEITEGVFMDDIKRTVDILKDLHSLGVELAIDDFGTGYSSLSYLSQFPIDRLKIDQSFVRNALNDDNDASIAKTIIGLGHSLNLSVIAEGVETKEHEQFLMEHDCDEVQGWRYSKAIPADEFVEFVHNYNGSLSSFDE